MPLSPEHIERLRLACLAYVKVAEIVIAGGDPGEEAWNAAVDELIDAIYGAPPTESEEI